MSFLASGRQLLGERGYGGAAARRAAERVSLYYGARSADLLAGVEDFRAAGADVRLATSNSRRVLGRLEKPAWQGRFS